MRPYLALAAAGVLASGPACAPEHRPQRIDASPSSAPRANGLEAEIASIVARYEPPEWRCSQYMFDMQDLGAHARVPEVVDLVERGAYSDEVNFMLFLMHDRAASLKPSLEALAQRPDAGVSQRAHAALQAIESGVEYNAKCRHRPQNKQMQLTAPASMERRS